MLFTGQSVQTGCDSLVVDHVDLVTDQQHGRRLRNSFFRLPLNVGFRDVAGPGGIDGDQLAVAKTAAHID